MSRRRGRRPRTRWPRRTSGGSRPCAPQGGPHATPLLAVWATGALHVCTGRGEQKWRNRAGNPRCSAITGHSDRTSGTDYVVEGVAERVVDDGRLRELADAWEAKYGPEWHFDVADGAFVAGGHVAEVFRVRPTVAYAFGKDPYSHTRYRWPARTGAVAAASLRDATVAVRLPAQDLDRARRFYADALGLEPNETRDGGLRYLCGDIEFVVFKSSGRRSGEHTQAGFYVDDIDATVAELSGRGVVFEQAAMDDLPVDGVVVDIPRYLSIHRGGRRTGGLVPRQRRQPARRQPARDARVACCRTRRLQAVTVARSRPAAHLG
ncbi:MAG TPA: VOC family protein [Euzebyales bacterium]|nr:VOC family protein [Euzebyales bacterium]